MKKFGSDNGKEFSLKEKSLPGRLAKRVLKGNPPEKGDRKSVLDRISRRAEVHLKKLAYINAVKECVEAIDWLYIV